MKLCYTAGSFKKGTYRFAPECPVCGVPKAWDLVPGNHVLSCHDCREIYKATSGDKILLIEETGAYKWPESP